jgi:hypothetical protein
MDERLCGERTGEGEGREERRRNGVSEREEGEERRGGIQFTQRLDAPRWMNKRFSGWWPV